MPKECNNLLTLLSQAEVESERPYSLSVHQLMWFPHCRLPHIPCESLNPSAPRHLCLVSICPPTLPHSIQSSLAYPLSCLLSFVSAQSFFGGILISLTFLTSFSCIHSMFSSSIAECSLCLIDNQITHLPNVVLLNLIARILSFYLVLLQPNIFQYC